MKYKYLFLIFIAFGLFLFTPKSHAAITLVQSTSTIAGSTATTTVKFATTTHAGNLIIVWTSSGTSSADPVKVTDNAGNTYATTTATMNNTGCGQNQVILYAKNIAATTTAITISIHHTSVASPIDNFAYEYSGLDTTSPLDGTSTMPVATVANASTSAITLTGTTDLAFSGAVSCTNNATAGANYTLQLKDTGNNLDTEDWTTASGTIKGVWVNTSQSITVTLAAFKAAASGAVTPPTPTYWFLSGFFNWVGSFIFQ